MTKKSPDLHGNAPDNARVVLLLVDVINDLEFAGGDELLTYARTAAQEYRITETSRQTRRHPRHLCK